LADRRGKKEKRGRKRKKLRVITVSISSLVQAAKQSGRRWKVKGEKGERVKPMIVHHRRAQILADDYEKRWIFVVAERGGGKRRGGEKRGRLRFGVSLARKSAAPEKIEMPASTQRTRNGTGEGEEGRGRGGEEKKLTSLPLASCRQDRRWGEEKRRPRDDLVAASKRPQPGKGRGGKGNR